MMTEKTVSILGATGSIGKSTVDVLRHTDIPFSVKALVGNRNISLLAEQAKTLRAEMAVTADETKYAELKELLAGTSVKVGAGKSAVLEAATMDADWTMSAIVGAAGLEPSAEVIKRGKTLALANKETLVCAGDIVMDMVQKYNTTLVPVDSEHSAIFQCLENNQKNAVDSLLLTASGGPFFLKDREYMETVTPQQAVAHPKWNMGAKISVDSATMMNKGLEIIEAHHLFAMPAEKINVVIHPQSIIHSAVAYIDGSVIAQLGNPDMRVPIAYAFGWPQRISSPVEKLDLPKIASLSFFTPDEEKFPALKLAKQALKAGSEATNVLNAANEIAVAAFLDRKIRFLDIAKVGEKVLENIKTFKLNSVDDAVALDKKARAEAEIVVQSLEPK
ncbi:MAG: 1-deoxy-D-xylulose-5-phosphate reductoisomerase [Alphaproteobacteria bacterium]|nr:1-deoxy-D-xylulose-5-phosphate reductoisomerase [Alphaproteobacteria bacterium]